MFNKSIFQRSSFDVTIEAQIKSFIFIFISLQCERKESHKIVLSLQEMQKNITIIGGELWVKLLGNGRRKGGERLMRHFNSHLVLLYL